MPTAENTACSTDSTVFVCKTLTHQTDEKRDDKSDGIKRLLNVYFDKKMSFKIIITTSCKCTFHREYVMLLPQR